MRFVRIVTLWLIPSTTFAFVSTPLAAQDTAQRVTLRVRVLSDSTPVAGARVRTRGVSHQTDAAGVASLQLPVGSHLITASRLGYVPDTVTVILSGGTDTSITTSLVRRETELEDVIVTATRAERRIEDTPLRVEVLEREEVEEKMLMTPGDISMMLNETGGLRVQTTSPSLGGANVRIQGLSGRYTLMLTDGLPLSGAQSGALGLLQIPPMDLARVEVVKGVASALYGASALGGVINLVTRRPGAESEGELLLNQTTRDGSDAILWTSGQLSEAWGLTLLGGGHRQARVDVDGDGWTDIPGYERAVVRPRVFWSGENGRSAIATLGTTLENRRGGTVGAALAPDGEPYSESLRTRRFDAGAVGRLPFGSSVLSLRGAGSTQSHRHQFGAIQERDRHDTWFAEASLASSHGRHTTVVGAAFQSERYGATDVPRFDYRYRIPAAFAQYDVELGDRLGLSVSGRGDFHSEFGSLFNPRVSVLYRIAEGWTVRASAGTGAFAPTPFTDETETAGLTPLRIMGDLRTERARSGSVDLGGAAGPIELNLTVFGSRIAHALLVRPSPSDPLAIEMFNATALTRTAGTDAMFRYRRGELATTLSYTYVDAVEQDPTGTGKRDVPLVPRHAAGLVSVWEREAVGRLGFEFYYTGRQPLEDNPYRTFSRPYPIVGAIAERHFGRMRLFVNLENLGNVRLTNHHPLVRPARGDGGRWTTDAWAPLDGRVFNGGVRIQLN